MASHSENYFYRLIAFMVDISYEVVREYFKKVLGAESFESFLSRNHHQLYHLFYARECCQCSSRQRITYLKCISEDQFKLIYNKNGNKIHKNNCSCLFTAKQNVKVAVLDITLAYVILNNCTTLPSRIETDLRQIKKIRNELVHKSDVNYISKENFEVLWQHMRDLVLRLTTEIDSSLKLQNEVSVKISTLYMRVMVSDDLLKKCILLHDWWRDKQLEIEKLQQEHFSALETRFDELEETSRIRHQEHLVKSTEILRRIDALTAKVNKLQYTVEVNNEFRNILQHSENTFTGRGGLHGLGKQNESGKLTVPVLCMIDVPDNWDKFKVINGIKGLQDFLTATESNLRIRSYSLQDIKMILDITQTVLQNPQNFKESLHEFMTTLVKNSDIDDTEECNMNLKVQSIAEEETTIPLEEVHKTDLHEDLYDATSGGININDLTRRKIETAREDFVDQLYDMSTGFDNDQGRRTAFNSSNTTTSRVVPGPKVYYLY